jgi:hypothetical protein
MRTALKFQTETLPFLFLATSFLSVELSLWQTRRKLQETSVPLKESELERAFARLARALDIKARFGSRRTLPLLSASLRFGAMKPLGWVSEGCTLVLFQKRTTFKGTVFVF